MAFLRRAVGRPGRSAMPSPRPGSSIAGQPIARVREEAGPDPAASTLASARRTCPSPGSSRPEVNSERRRAKCVHRFHDLWSVSDHA
eukprot:40562-Rhodomonas_salina.3